MKKIIAISLFVSVMGLAAQASAASYGPFKNVESRANAGVSAAKPGYGDSASCMGSTMSQKLLTTEQKKALDKEGILALARTNYGDDVLGTDGDHSGKP